MLDYGFEGSRPRNILSGPITHTARSVITIHDAVIIPKVIPLLPYVLQSRDAIITGQ